MGILEGMGERGRLAESMLSVQSITQKISRAPEGDTADYMGMGCYFRLQDIISDYYRFRLRGIIRDGRCHPFVRAL